MENFFQKQAFWIIQVLAWSAFGIFTTIVGLNFEHPLNLFFLLVSVFIAGFLATSIHRWLLKNYAAREKWSSEKIWTISGIIFLSTTLYFFLLYTFGFVSGYLSAYLQIPDTYIPKPPRLSGQLFLFVVGFIFITLWTILYFGIKTLISYNIARIQRLRLRDQVKKARLNTLKGHINIKFLVQVLRKIKELMLTDIPKSRKMLTELSELLRYSLTKNAIDWSELAEELEIARKYLNLKYMDLPSVPDIDYDAALLSKPIEIPPMLLLNFVEFSYEGMTQDETSDGAGPMRIISENNGILFKFIRGGHASISVESKRLQGIIEQRLRLLYGKEAAFRVEREFERSIFSMLFPITVEKEKTSEI
ncbi:MAG: histidine kinase [Pricia sp.]